MVIGVIALVVIGPERLPAVARTVGRWVGKVQRFVRGVKTDFANELQSGDLQKIIGDQNEQINELRSIVTNARNELKASADEVNSSTRSSMDGFKKLIDDDAPEKPTGETSGETPVEPPSSHLIELRDRLIKIVVVVGVLFLVLFFWREPIYTAFASPLQDQLGENGRMQAIDPAGSFFAPLKLVLMLSVFIAMPFPLLVSSTGLFYLGVAFAYYVVFPLVFAFFTAVAPEGVEVNTDISRYLDFAITLFFAFGIAFEVPVATVILVLVGITTPDQLVKVRAYVFVGAFIVGMFLTPPDFISQTLLAIPMWLLYEVGIIFSRTLKVRVGEAADAVNDQTDVDTSTANAALENDRLALDRKPDAPNGSYRNSLTDAEDDPKDLGP